MRLVPADADTIGSLAARYRRGEASPVEVVGRLLERIDEVEPKVNAYITVDREGALRQAAEAERRLASPRPHPPSPMLGIPVAVKDSIDVRGLPATVGSRLFRDRVARSDARSVVLLRRAGAIVIGKTNLDEFGMGVATQNSHFGGTVNPHDPRHDPGGSSGGSAAALASGLCVAALGGDTAGSIRAAAAACGVVGLKPTAGRVSTRGAFPHNPTRDTVGPMARTVEDTARLLGVIAGYDHLDASSVDSPVPDYAADLDRGVSGLRIGAIPASDLRGDHPAVRGNFAASLRALDRAGAEVEEVELPLLADAVRAGWAFLAETAWVHRRWFPTRAEAYSPRVRHVLTEIGELPAADLAAAHELRRTMITRYRSLLRGRDALVLPAVPTPAPRIGQETITLGGTELVPIVAILRYLPLFNLIGFPALAVPNGADRHGLPTSVQIVARPWEESVAFRIGRALES